MDEMDKLKELFFNEAGEILDELDRLLLDMEADPADTETLNTIFRHMHTLKGSSGMFEFYVLERFTHLQEDLLDYLRSQNITPTAEMIDLLFESLDMTKLIFAMLKAGETVGDEVTGKVEERIKEFLPEKESAAVEKKRAADPGICADFVSKFAEGVRSKAAEAADDGKKLYQIGIKLNKDCFSNGMDPFLLLKCLSFEGEILLAYVGTEGIPRIDQLDPLLLHFEEILLLYSSTSGLSAVDDVFEFAHEAGTIELHQFTPGELSEHLGVDADPFWLEAQKVDEEEDSPAPDKIDPAIFFTETDANLDELELNLVTLEKNPDDKETLNVVFRLFHNIKGNAEIYGLSDISRVTHSAETILDNLRSGNKLTPRITDILLRTIEEIKRMTDMARERGCAGGEDGGDLQADESVVKRLGDILVEMGEINEAQLSDALKKQTRPKLGEILEDEGLVSKENIDRALEKQKLMSIAKQTAIRIDTEKLDSLGNLAGELVIVESMLSQSRALLDLHDPAVAKTLSQLNKITRYIQEQVMGMRMLPIKGTFQKLMRVVRDTSRKAGKEVELITSGEGTEMDKTIIEDIGDPLVHIIRNSIDHGIELPEDRAAAGKSKKGVVELKASHRGGNIVIEVIDDGKGLDKERILAKAVKTGLVEANKNLTDEQIYNFIFEPGFSTASVVTDLSGRGVGMDVVNKNIEKLNGNIEVSSTEGKGTTLTIRLPLTLAIIDGMLVRVGSERYIIPTISIIESFKADREQFFTVEDKGEMVKIRENLLPVLRLHEIFNIIPSHEKPWDGIVIHIEGMGKKGGVLVDDLLGQQQVVIKSMGEAFRGLNGISGSAIMGDGNVVLILDSGGILDMAV